MPIVPVLNQTVVVKVAYEVDATVSPPLVGVDHVLAIIWSVLGTLRLQSSV